MDGGSADMVQPELADMAQPIDISRASGDLEAARCVLTLSAPSTVSDSSAHPNSYCSAPTATSSYIKAEFGWDDPANATGRRIQGLDAGGRDDPRRNEPGHVAVFRRAVDELHDLDWIDRSRHRGELLAPVGRCHVRIGHGAGS
jgi:hypothetical protein